MARSFAEECLGNRLETIFDSVQYEPMKSMVPVPYVPDFVIPDEGIIVECKGIAQHFDRVKMLGMQTLIDSQLIVDDVQYFFYVVCPQLDKKEFDYFDPNRSVSRLTKGSSNTLTGLDLCYWLKNKGITVSPFMVLNGRAVLCRNTFLSRWAEGKKVKVPTRRLTKSDNGVIM